MPTTANFELPYPGALDEPCDFAEDWCAFTDAAGAVLSGFQATADRVYPVQPVAKMEITTNTIIARGSIVPFDSVVVNNADYIDFDASNSTITVKRAGRFIAIFNGFVGTTGVANSRYLVDFGFVPTSEDISEELDLATSALTVNATAIYNSVITPFDIYVALDSSAAVATLQIARAALSVFWHSDRAAP